MSGANSFIIDEHILLKIPTVPGVYQFSDYNGKVIYIGKAKDLKSRIGQYISLTDSRPMVSNLMEMARSVEIILTPSETEALILESSFIKKKQPLFNINLKDDKSYPYLAVTLEEWSRLVITRHPARKYLFIRGPFFQATLLNSLKNLLHSLYPLKYCGDKNPDGCINFQMGICPAPCRKNTDKTQYMSNVKNIVEVLQGKKWKELSDIIREKIERYSQLLNFEKAAELRDTLKIVPEIQKKFGVEFSGRGVDDFFIFRKFGEMLFTVWVRYHDGKLFSLKTFSSGVLFDSMESCIAGGIASFYRNITPAEKISIEPQVLEKDQIGTIIGFPILKSGKIPGNVRKILEANLEQSISTYIKESTKNSDALNELSQFMKSEVKSIMCIDISTLYGDYTVAGAVWWENGKFNRKNYRKYKIRSITGIDDFGSLKEVAVRLLRKWNESGCSKPSMLLIDGGKGQVSSVNSILSGTIPIAGIIKDRGNIKGKEMLIDIDGNELTLTDSVLAIILKSIRNETHRFSISFNKSLRKNVLSSTLTEIEGIGKDKEIKLLNHFKTIGKIRTATISELMAVKGISEPIALKIYSFFH